MPDSPTSAQTGLPRKRDAILFLPGIGGAEQSLEFVARKLAVELERFAKDSHWQFVTEIRDETLGDRERDKVKVCTISRRRSKSDAPLPVIDVFAVDYLTSLRKDFEDRRLITKSLLLLLTILRNLPRVLRAFFATSAKGKTVIEKAQALYTLAVFLVVASYTVILLLAAGGLVAQILGSGIQAQFTQVFGGLVVLITLFGTLSKDDARQFIARAATDYVSVLNYLDYGNRRREITGEVEMFLDQIAQRWGDEYANYHIVAYSFGSIVALDTLYPPGVQPSQDAPPTVGVPPGELIKQVRTLITIGSPFDLIRTYWPSYFNPRILTNADRDWVNIYSPIDLLGSNFRNDDRREAAVESLITSEPKRDGGPKPSENLSYEPEAEGRRMGVWEFFTMAALQAHSQYWDASSIEGKSCFSIFVPLLYPHLGDPETLEQTESP